MTLPERTAPRSQKLADLSAQVTDVSGATEQLTGPPVSSQLQNRRQLIRLFWFTALYVGAMMAAGTIVLWPIYEHLLLGLTALTAFLVAAGITLGSLVWRWSTAVTAGVAVAGYFVGGVVPALWGSQPSLDAVGDALLQLLIAPVVGWKNTLTLNIPVGNYQNILITVYFLVYLSAFLSLFLGVQPRSWWPVLVIPVALPIFFGKLFGAPSEGGVLDVLLGCFVVLVTLVYVRGRMQWLRRLSELQQVGDARINSRRPGSSGGRVSTIAMVVVAALASAALLPLGLASSPAWTLRSGINAQDHVVQAGSPLLTFRSFQQDENFHRNLFRISGDGVEGGQVNSAVDQRIRLATLSHYDGRALWVVDPGTPGSSAFVRVPAALEIPQQAVATTVTVQIEEYSDIWLPLVGGLGEITFPHESDQSNAYRVFYQREGQMAVLLPEDSASSRGTDGGEDRQVPETNDLNDRQGQLTYVQQGWQTVNGPVLAQIQPGAADAVIAGDLVPESLVEWVSSQNVSRDGGGLSVLVQRLRDRGMLSHAVEIDPLVPPQWLAQLTGAGFAASRAGHSTDRIDLMFRDLMRRQLEAGPGASDADLVAAVGDDEQFSVAVMMIANQLGFAARVVVGARLGSDDPSLPTCQDGVCMGAAVAAWVEVQDTSGQWVAVDVTPQHRNPIAPSAQQRTEPQNPTIVTPQQANQLPPVPASPVERSRTEPETRQNVDLTVLWQVLTVGGLLLLVALLMAGPLIFILLRKALRRGKRRSAPRVRDRITLGWEEYVDTAVDHGHPKPSAQTRRELALLYAPPAVTGLITERLPRETGAASVGSANPAVLMLADWADRADFDLHPPEESEAAAFWQVLEQERARFAVGQGRWPRWRAAASLRSFRRGNSWRGKLPGQPGG